MNKMSTLQIVTIVSILFLGFTAVAPFVQIAEPHGQPHEYNAPVDIVMLTKCEYCGAWTVTILGEMIMPFLHGPDQEHITRGTLYLYGTTSMCSNCEYSHYV